MDFANNKNIILGISEKKDGPMKGSLENRLLFFKKQGLENRIIVSAGLVQGNRVVVIDNPGQEGTIPDCDALITDNSQFLLTVTVADCLPIYFYDKNRQVVALAHAGWRGTVSEIVKKVIDSFISRYHSQPGDIEVFIGPHIRDCHFEVKNDVASYFKDSDLAVRNGKIYVNLSQAVQNQLIESGILADNITVSQECTYCSENKFFSFRRDNPKDLEALVSYLGLK